MGLLIMVLLILVTIILLHCQFAVQVHARNGICISLWNDSETITTKYKEECSNFHHHLLKNSTFCLPYQDYEEQTTFVSWYSYISNIVKKHSTVGFNTQLLYGSHDMLTTDSSKYSYHHVSIVMGAALLNFIEKANWQRMAIIVDSSGEHFLQVVEYIYKNLKPKFPFHLAQVTNSEADVIEKKLRTLINLKFRVIITVLPASILEVMLCKRMSLGMSWPEYVWVILNIEGESSGYSKCHEKIIIFQSSTSQQGREVIPIKFDMLRNINTVGTYFSIPCYHYMRTSLDVSIFLNQKKRKPIANFSLPNNLSAILLDYIPSDLPIESSVAWYIVISITFAASFTFVTAMFVIYICLRQEPSIKATGVTLNVLTFLGCYMLLIYIPVVNIKILPEYHLFDNEFKSTMCALELWLNGFSLPSALIVTVLLVKLVRVYKLFNHYGMVKKWQCHDATLAVYVLALSSPIIMSCVGSTGMHDYVSTKVTRVSNGIFIAYNDCHSDVALYWRIGQLAYFYFICALLTIMAIKTRKIRHQNFKDTKKVIAMVIASFVTSCLTLVYLIVLGAIELHPLYLLGLQTISHTLFVLECQFFLFVPKVFPLLSAKVSHLIFSNSMK